VGRVEKPAEDGGWGGGHNKRNAFQVQYTVRTAGCGCWDRLEKANLTQRRRVRREDGSRKIFNCSPGERTPRWIAPLLIRVYSRGCGIYSTVVVSEI
jgi:hypothetical protein